MDEPESTFNEESMDDEIVELITKLNELYREAQLSQTEDNSVVKSNVLAKKYMNDGLEHFFKKSFEDACRLYTLCVACAEEDSEVIGEAYANRSAVLLKLGYFEQCLLDIDRALKSNYPEDKRKSLHERKEQASKKAEQSPPLASSRTSEVEAEWRDKLCDFQNPHIPGASNKIKLESNEEWGRHLVATEKINAGEILTCQKFFTMVKTQDVCTNHVCSYCLLYHPALIPCPTCALAMYCSEHCRTEAFNSYHRMECRIFQTQVVRQNKLDAYDFAALRCLLVGTDQGAGLASLMKKIRLQDIVDLEANIDKFTEKPFPSDYMFLLRLCRKFHLPLVDKAKFIPKIIIALQKAGYFDSVSDPRQLIAKPYLLSRWRTPKIILMQDGREVARSVRKFVAENESFPWVAGYMCIVVPTLSESDDKKEDPDEGKNEERPTVQEHADSFTMVDVATQKDVTEASERSTTMSEAHIDAKDGNNNESVCEKDDGYICSKALDSVEVADESVDKKEDPDVCKNEGIPIIQEQEDSSRIVGKEFVKKVTYHSCELCNICLYYNPEISQDEIVLSHCHTPLHVERCSARNPEEQEVTTQECVAETSPSKNVVLGTMAKKPQLNSASKRKKRRRRKAKARLDSASARSDDANEQKRFQDVTTHQERVTGKSRIKKVRRGGTKAKKPPKRKRGGRKKTNKAPLNSTSSRSDNVNEQEKFKHEAPLNAKYGNNNESVYENGDINSKVLESIEVVDESVDKKEDPDVGKNEDRPIVQEHEDSSRIADGLKLAIMLLATVILESNDKKEDPDGSENEDRPQGHEDSPKIAGKEFIKEVSRYYCEVCNLCLCYKQEMSEDEALTAHCSTPLHLKQSSFRTTEETECVPGTSQFKNVTLGKMAKEPRLDSPSPPKSDTEPTAPPLDSLPASSDANEQNLVERQGFVLVKERSLFENVYLAKPGPSITTPQDDACSVDSNANQHQKTYLTEMELYASFLLLNHSLSLDNATFSLRKLSYSKCKNAMYGYGVCNLHAMLNHSCDPNVDFIIRGQEMALYALRPISEGEQIFFAYTVISFAFSELQSRQQMKTKYPTSKFQFNCECVACVNKWPMYSDLLKLRPKFLISTDKKAAIEAIHKITSPLLRKTIDSTSRLETLQVICQLCEWFHINIERPSAASALCEQLLTRATKHFYDTSSPIEFTELHKKKILQSYLLRIINSKCVVPT